MSEYWNLFRDWWYGGSIQAQLIKHLLALIICLVLASLFFMWHVWVVPYIFVLLVFVTIYFLIKDVLHLIGEDKKE